VHKILDIIKDINYNKEMKINDFRALPSKAQEDIRKKAVNAVLSGKKQIEVAKLFGITRQAVGEWLKLYKTYGKKSLNAKRRGRPKGVTLDKKQSLQIIKAITDRNPEQLKLPFYLWTREAVANLIERKFKICLSIWTVGRYLSRWGFTPQKPQRRAFEQNKEYVKNWLKKEYPAIRKQAKREKALIYWGDEMGLRSDHSVGRSYSPCGKTPLVLGTGQRFGCNMISAITNRGHLNFMVFKSRFRSPVFLEFIKRLLKQSEKKVYLIIDGHPVHRSKKIKEWVKQNSKKIKMFFLPGYSPELNPDEILNQDVKSNSVGRRRAKNLSVSSSKYN